MPQLPRWPRHHLRQAACLSIMEQGKLQPKCLSALLCVALMHPSRRCQLAGSTKAAGREERAKGGLVRLHGDFALPLPQTDPWCSDPHGWHHRDPASWPCLVLRTPSQQDQSQRNRGDAGFGSGTGRMVMPLLTGLGWEALEWVLWVSIGVVVSIPVPLCVPLWRQLVSSTGTWFGRATGWG